MARTDLMADYPNGARHHVAAAVDEMRRLNVERTIMEPLEDNQFQWHLTGLTLGVQTGPSGVRIQAREPRRLIYSTVRTGPVKNPPKTLDEVSTLLRSLPDPKPLSKAFMDAFDLTMSLARIACAGHRPPNRHLVLLRHEHDVEVTMFTSQDSGRTAPLVPSQGLMDILNAVPPALQTKGDEDGRRSGGSIDMSSITRWERHSAGIRPLDDPIETMRIIASAPAGAFWRRTDDGAA